MAYDDPHGLMAMTIILELLAITAVALRFFSRSKQRIDLRIDDWSALGSLILATGLCIVHLHGYVTGALAVPLDKSWAQQTSHILRRSGVLQLSSYYLALCSLTLTKLTAVFLYRRIFGRIRVFKIFTTIWITVILLWGFTFLMGLTFECGTHYTAFLGTYEEYTKHCPYLTQIGTGYVVSDAVTDLITLVMPLTVIHTLKCSLKRKLAIAAVFAVGALSVVASAIKAAIYLEAVMDILTGDYIINTTRIMVWQYIEVIVGIIATCAVTFKPVLAYMQENASIRSLVSSIMSSRSSEDSGPKPDSQSSSPQTNGRHDSQATMHDEQGLVQPPSKILTKDPFADEHSIVNGSMISHDDGIRSNQT